MSIEPDEIGAAKYNLGQALQALHDGDLIEAAALGLLSAELLIATKQIRLGADHKDQLLQQLNAIYFLLDPKYSARMWKAEAAKLTKKAKRTKEHKKERAERKKDSKIRGLSRRPAIKGAKASAIFGLVTGSNASKRAVSRALSNGRHKLPTETILSFVKREQKKLGSKPKK